MTKSAWKGHFWAPSPLSKIHFESKNDISREKGSKFSQLLTVKWQSKRCVFDAFPEGSTNKNYSIIREFFPIYPKKCYTKFTLNHRYLWKIPKKILFFGAPLTHMAIQRWHENEWVATSSIHLMQGWCRTLSHLKNYGWALKTWTEHGITRHIISHHYPNGYECFTTNRKCLPVVKFPGWNFKTGFVSKVDKNAVWDGCRTEGWRMGRLG